jgi:hypothetical protein
MEAFLRLMKLEIYIDLIGHFIVDLLIRCFRVLVLVHLEHILTANVVLLPV